MLDDVRLLSAGFCTHPEAMTRRGAAWVACRFPGGFALMRHAREGAILFDTGYSERFHAQTERFPAALYARITPVHVSDVETARHQVSLFGVAPSDVRFVILSHFHADHIAGLQDFAQARVICSRAGWESVRAARGIGALLKGFLPGLLPSDIEARLAFAEESRVIRLPPEFDGFGVGRDLFGDGSIVAVDLPGHAPGHIGLLLDAPNGQVFLVGDAAWSQEAIESATAPPWITTSLLGNTRSYRATLARLSALRRAMPHLEIVPSHCARALGTGSPA